MRILVIDHIHQAGIHLLQEHAKVVYLAKAPSAEELASIIGDYHALIMRVTPKIDRRVLERGRKLKVISVASVGTDHIDLVAAAELGIHVINQPGVNRDSVAEFTFGLMLCLTRMIPQAAAQLREGVWNRNGFQHGIELRGRTLGIIGFGYIGTRVAELAKGFKMRTIGFSPYTNERKASEYGIKLASLDELLTESDVITIHCPLTPETRNLIGSKELKKMRPGSYLLNLARGGIVDELALYESLLSGQLAAAAADVFSVEPPVNNPLLRLPNFIGTPHIAGPTRDSLWRAGVGAAEQALQYLGIDTNNHLVPLAAQA